MAPPKNKRPQVGAKPPVAVTWKKFLEQWILNPLCDPHYLTPMCIFLLLLEVVLNICVIEKVKYTEIDWGAYMHEVEGFLNGTLDYKQLNGSTGPLVYPAGFVYIFAVLYYVTSQGQNIYLAQYIFAVLYLIQTALVYRIFIKTLKLPPYALPLVTLTSYRIHSIFVLRLFNDPIAVLLFYVSLNFFISKKWILGSLFYSLAVSVKMNILLYAPCLLVAYLTNLTIFQTVFNLFICGFVQLVLGFPFLYGNSVSYLKGSFDFGRVFNHTWTVNYRFLPHDYFVNHFFHIFLLFLHFLLLILFAPSIIKYLRSYARLSVVTDELKIQFENEKRKKRKENNKLNKTQQQFLESFEKQLQGSGRQREDDYVSDDQKLQDNLSKITQLFVLPFFVTNLIGIACARSLHYQFYSWYFHSLLYLVFCTGYSTPLRFLLLGLFEYCWNVYPSTEYSSLILHFCHIVLLLGLYKTMNA